MANDGGDGDKEIGDLQALERFVVDNDDLLELEARIGRFNIFDALRIDRAEIRHSNFLAWLLDPAESHGQGSLFLKAILMDLLKRAGEEGLPRALSPVELDGVELQGVEVRREWRSIDLLITCKDPPFVVAIENKVDSGEHSDQLQRYEKIVREGWPDVKKQFVFLTREGEDASDEDWVPYSYADIHRVLRRCRDANFGGIGDDVRTFLNHYLNLIGTRFMSHIEIETLCKTIYKNHRRAIDLIVSHVASPRAEAVRVLADAVKVDPRWEVLNITGQQLNLWPVAWNAILPAIGARPKFPANKWAFLQVRVGSKRCGSMVRVAPTTDEGLRRDVIRRLVQDPKEFGLKSLFKSTEKVGSKWASLGRQRILEWPADEEPEPEELIEAMRRDLDKRHAKFARVPDALRPIIAEWEAKQGRSA